jgi:DNA repair ATPase RecN
VIIKMEMKAGVANTKRSRAPPEYAKSDFESAEGVLRYPERFESGLEANSFACFREESAILPRRLGRNVAQRNDGGAWCAREWGTEWIDAPLIWVLLLRSFVRSSSFSFVKFSEVFCAFLRLLLFCIAEVLHLLVALRYAHPVCAVLLLGLRNATSSCPHMTSAYSSRAFVDSSGKLLPRSLRSQRRRTGRCLCTVSRRSESEPMVRVEVTRGDTSSTTHLRELCVRNFALVDELHVSFHPRLNIITGQSGSGKSVLLEAIAQLCGASAREECIRSGADCAELEGRFCVGRDTITEINSVLRKQDVPELAEPSSSQSSVELVVERRLAYIDDQRPGSGVDQQSADINQRQTQRRIRSVCRVNNTVVPVKCLRELGKVLIDFNGQGTAGSIADEEAQKQLLDDWAGTRHLRRRFDELAGVLLVHRSELALLEEISLDERQELSNLIDTVQAVEPVRGEDVALKSELRRLEEARMTVDTCSSVMSTLGGDGSVVDTQGSVRSGISNASMQIKGLLSNAQRSALSVGAERGNNASSGAGEATDSLPIPDGSSDDAEAALAGLRDALSKCRQAELLVSEAERRVADYVTLLRADPYYQEECVTRLRKLDRLCRSIGVRCVEEAFDAAEVRNFATHRFGLSPLFVNRPIVSRFLRVRTQTISSTMITAQVAKARLDAVENFRERRETLTDLAAAAEAELAEAGLKLATSRRTAAGALRRDVTIALSKLAMEGCRFDVSLSWEHISSDQVIPATPPALSIYVDESAIDIGEEGSSQYRVQAGGLDRVTFLLAAGPNESLRSMSSVASGGETARLLLAMKLSPAIRATHWEESVEPDEVPGCARSLQGELRGVAAEAGLSSLMQTRDAFGGAVALKSRRISIFDELDSGVGARIGGKIGSSLRLLAEKGNQQVLCVTHLPQVAAFGDRHLRISKEVAHHGSAQTTEVSSESRIRITVEVLQDDESRIEEISSMLGLGDDEGRRSAVRMLQTSAASAPDL